MRYLLFLAVVFACICYFGYHAIYKNGSTSVAVWLSAFFFYLLLVLYLVIKSKPKLALYFEARVPGNWVWSAALARNCVFLDEICDSLGVAALSSFGFADEQRHKAMVWHAPEEGRQTATALIRQLRHDPAPLAEAALILADLQQMTNRLREAEKCRVEFCFILHEPSMSGQELDLRRGRF